MIINMLITVYAVSVTVALVALFAMMGELNNRVEALTSQRKVDDYETPDDWADQIQEHSAKTPTAWPSELKSFKDRPTTLLIVLSSSCRTCDRFLHGELDALSDFGPAYIISTSSKTRGQSFLKKNPIPGKWPTYIDVGGDWSREQLGIEVSPSAILYEDGEVVDAFTMSSPEQLANVLHERLAPINTQKGM